MTKRELEPGMRTDLADRMTYAGYLQLDKLLAAQTPLGRALYVHYRLDPHNYESMILIADGVPALKSSAVIGIAQGLGPPWSLAAALRALPRTWRDRLYDVLARNRFRMFGRRATCYLPDPRDADRFLA